MLELEQTLLFTESGVDILHENTKVQITKQTRCIIIKRGKNNREIIVYYYII